MSGYTVKLYIYDLSMGLASQLSSSVLGQQIEGIWHTGVVVYGQEYAFGSLGIYSTPPGSMLHQPVKIEQLGVTKISPAKFNDFLLSIASQYQLNTYNLLSHNCNNFSNSVIKFLLGISIPSYILDLPNEFLQTPFGAMLKPTIEGMVTQLQSNIPNNTGNHCFYVNNYELPDVYNLQELNGTSTLKMNIEAECDSDLD